VFGDERATLGDAAGQISMLRRIDDIKPAAQYGHRISDAAKPTTVGRCIDPSSQTTDHGDAAIAQV
jgi:hypothetical protein